MATAHTIHTGYLQHGQQPGPFRTERVTVRHLYGDRYEAHFEGRWRLVHVQVNRLYIVWQGQRITLQIEGNPL